MYVAATLEATLLPAPEPRPAWRELMSTMSQEAWQGYRQMIYEDSRFLRYFQQVTPGQELQRLPLGSRPARRSATAGIEHLRAIPWVFAWTQMRLLLPAWLGVDTALKGMLSRGALPLMQEMLEQWPHCRMVFGMLEMVLAKTDAGIARYYEQRLSGAEDRELGEQLRGRLADMIDLILAVQGRGQLLQNNPAIRRSIEVRNPYLDPLHVLQVELMRRLRCLEVEDEAQPELKPLMVTVAGIAAGMRNTG
jgi:phosphoenolpyruvate carboxylase